MVRRIVANGKCGWYYRVLEAGETQAGDTVDLVERTQDRWSVAAVFTWLFDPRAKRTVAQANDILSLPALGPVWQAKVARKSV
jgi:MOSC domain-containing protein YiiM